MDRLSKEPAGGHHSSLGIIDANNYDFNCFVVAKSVINLLFFYFEFWIFGVFLFCSLYILSRSCINSNFISAINKKRHLNLQAIF